MKQKLMTIFTRTPLHVGMGSAIGAIDQPVIRERHTNFPVIPGSAIKGVLRDFVHNDDALKKIEEKIFGHEAKGKDDCSSAGWLGFGEGRILAFPLRSAKGSFALVTCPLALARYARDAEMNWDIPDVADGDCRAAEKVKLENNQVALEEYVFSCGGDFPTDWSEHLSGLLEDAVLQEAKTHFVLLSDGDFSYFCMNACQIQFHNRIGENGVVVDGALFNTETVPSETLFYAPVHVMRKEADDNALFDYLKEERIFQFGGDSTTGLGFSSVKLV